MEHMGCDCYYYFVIIIVLITTIIISYDIIYIWKELWPLKILRGPAIGPLRYSCSHRQAAEAVADLTLGEISGSEENQSFTYQFYIDMFFTMFTKSEIY